jgi:hypothetical protein
VQLPHVVLTERMFTWSERGQATDKALRALTNGT